MVPWWSLLIVAAVMGAIWVAPLFADAVGRKIRQRYRNKAAEEWSARYKDEVAEVCAAVRRNGIRYEIRMVQWSTQEWRWSIFDADAVLLAWNGEVRVGGVGIEVPYADGLGKTRANAEAQALTWIARRPDAVPEFPPSIVIPAP